MGKIMDYLDRKVISCHNQKCKLRQFVAQDRKCRRCHQPVDLPKAESKQSTPCPQLSSEPPVLILPTLDLGGVTLILRKAFGMSQRQLAERMQCERTYISGIECGRRIPLVQQLERLARGFDVSPYTYLYLAENIAQ